MTSLKNMIIVERDAVDVIRVNENSANQSTCWPLTKHCRNANVASTPTAEQIFYTFTDRFDPKTVTAIRV